MIYEVELELISIVSGQMKGNQSLGRPAGGAYSRRKTGRACVGRALMARMVVPINPCFAAFPH